MRQGLDNYKFPKKNHWRRWQWNRITERVKIHKPISQSIGIYLTGPDDHDRNVALSKGFKNQNLIGVDLDAHNIATVKENPHVPAISMNLCDLLRQWVTPKIDFIVGDFCCGLTKFIVIDLISTLVHNTSLSVPCIISINLMRGRDAFANPVREYYREYNIKHRGQLFALLLLKHTKIMYAYMSTYKIKHEDDIDPEHLNLCTPELNKLIYANQGECTAEALMMTPVSCSYRSASNRITMDNMIFAYWPKLFTKFGPDPEIDKATSGMVHRIAALKAWRTMRSA